MDNKLKADFPIEWELDNYVSRREFFKFLTVVSGGLAAGNVFLAASSLLNKESIAFEPQLICSSDELATGESLGFTYPQEHDLCILVRRQNGELAAYSRRCTHLSCPVSFQPDKDRLYCPCHNGAFAAGDGTVLQGPPLHPLPRIVIEERGNDIWAIGVTKSKEEE